MFDWRKGYEAHGSVSGEFAGLPRCTGSVSAQCASLTGRASLTNSYASAVSSCCSERATWVSALGMVMAEKDSPVCEKVESSTPVTRIPREMGKLDFCDDMVMLWRTTDCARNDGVSGGCVVAVVLMKQAYLEVALRLGVAREVGELLLPHDRTKRRSRAAWGEGKGLGVLKQGVIVPAGRWRGWPRPTAAPRWPSACGGRGRRATRGC